MNEKELAHRVYIATTQMIPEIRTEVEKLNKQLNTVEKNLETANELLNGKTVIDKGGAEDE